MALLRKIPLAIRTGVFVGLGFVILAGAVFVLGERKQLFSDQYEIYSMYDVVAGLQEGAFVRIAGINVGTVKRIALPEEVGGRVRVTFKIRADAKRLIRTDSKAVIDTEGLLGARIVIITQGSPSAPEVPAGGEILGQSPIQLHRFSQNIDRALEDLDDVVVNGAATLASLSSILAKVDAGRGSVGMLLNRPTLHDSLAATLGMMRRAATNTNRLLLEVRRSVDVMSESADATMASYRTTADTLTSTFSDFRMTSAELRGLANDVRSGRGTLGRLITDDSMYVAATHLVTTADSLLAQGTLALAEATEASHSIARSAEQIRLTLDQVTTNIMEGEGTVGKLVNDDSVYVKLNRTMTNLEIASQKMAVNMEAVRTNWLFRGYFEDQGYWDDLEMKVEVTEQREYRLRRWEERLQELQMRLEAQEQRMEARERQLREASMD